MMKFYKTLSGEVYAFELDGSQDYLIKSEMVEMTKDEIDRHENPDKYRTEEEKLFLKRRSLPKLTKRKFQLYMLDHGFLDDVENAIDAIEDSVQRRRMQIEYSSSDDFERLSPAVKYIAGLLGWSDEQIDTMWQQALML